MDSNYPGAVDITLANNRLEESVSGAEEALCPWSPEETWPPLAMKVKLIQ